MEDFEKLGAFYLGKVYDMKKKAVKDEALLYDSKDLTTHAAVVGMTGSGKTGLCIGLIEEAAIDGVPSILIDPKGDLGNLLLTFPDLEGADFLPWVNPDEARNKNLTPEAYADKQAALWSKGLGEWGQGGARIQRLREAAEMLIYTPGSAAGLPVSILKSFAAPGKEILEDTDLLRERISATVSSLLGLVGVEADPIQSREHILLSTILDTAWRAGKDLDLAGLIQQVQAPPVQKIGVLDLETVYPSKERFGLVMALNNLLASPGFDAWLEGTPLDIGQILYTPQGKPRVAIFSIAHLGDPERMFFVSLLMNQVLAWMRSQPGTTSLRAIVYMDEIFGYLPPTANPPSKMPMLTLLKQARAFGVGLVLATQNPVDLDYKALSNMGTWFIGRLQTERDKERLLDGLESAGGGGFQRSQIEKIISDLGNRVFLVNNTHEDAPELFQTRWALSYLRGPLTRDQVKTLMQPYKDGKPTASQPGPAPAPAMGSGTSSQPPSLPPGLKQFFVPARGGAPGGSGLVYQPQILGAAKVRYSDSKAKVDTSASLVYVTPVTDDVIPVLWDKAETLDVPATDLEKSARGGAQFGALPSAASQAKHYADWEKDFATWLYGSQRLDLLQSPSLKAASNPGEDERDFRIRLSQLAREHRDQLAEALRKKYAPKIAALQERQRKAEATREKQEEQAKKAKIDTALSVGATLLGAFAGRKVFSQSNISKARSAMRGVTKSADEGQDVKRAGETVEAAKARLADLQAEFEAEMAALEEKIDPLTEAMETISLKPKKTDIQVQLLTLAWLPFWQDEEGALTAAW
ncbi:MAG: helicase HerA domain-containing protein [Chloroflexota bacterium]